MFGMDAWFDFIHTLYICNNSGAMLPELLQVCQRLSEPRTKNHWLCLDRIREGFLEEVTWQAMMGKAIQGIVQEKDAWKKKKKRRMHGSIKHPAVVKCLCFPPHLKWYGDHAGTLIRNFQPPEL